MNGKHKRFLTVHVDILEDFLQYLWKEQITIKEKYIYTQKNLFQVDFIINDKETIRMKAEIELLEKDVIIRVRYTSHHYQNFDEIKNFLIISFYYCCPPELLLCNQFGLYQKKDIKEIENFDEIKQCQIDRNLLGDNLFFIFNMRRIKEHCQDKALDQLLQDFDQMVQNYYYKQKD